MNLIQAWLHWFSGNKLSEDTTVCLIWCWKLLIWSRWGKVIQFISATAIVADIIGAEKLRRIGESLRRSFPANGAKRHFLNTAQWLRKIYEDILLDLECKEISERLFSGEISREEYEQQKNLILEKRNLHPYTRKESENFISYLQRIFGLSLLDKLNVFCSLAILIIYGIPWAREVHLFMLSEVIPLNPNPSWVAYPSSLAFPLIMIFFVFFMSLLLVSPIVVSVVMFALAFFVLFVDFVIIRRIAWLLERPKVENWVKIISLILLLIGFHFDLLAS